MANLLVVAFAMLCLTDVPVATVARPLAVDAGANGEGKGRNKQPDLACTHKRSLKFSNRDERSVHCSVVSRERVWQCARPWDLIKIHIQLLPFNSN
jgi:hypothetical protein